MGKRKPTPNFRVLLTNDDGIYARGMVELARVLSPQAEVTIVAPDGPRSAASHSITLHKPLRLKSVDDFPWPENALKPHRAYSCSGSPADCVMLGLLELLKRRKPHVIISGINEGPNMAEDLIYSGTVGAAVEAAIIGFPSFAVSLDYQGQGNFATAAYFSKLLISRLFFNGRKRWTGVNTKKIVDAFGGKFLLNVNVPDLPVAKVKGIRVCKPGMRGYRDVIQKMYDPRGKALYWIAGERFAIKIGKDTDLYAVGRGYVAVTPMTWELVFEPAMMRLKRALSDYETLK